MAEPLHPKNFGHLQRWLDDLSMGRAAWVEVNFPYGDEPWARLHVTLRDGTSYAVEAPPAWVQSQHALWSEKTAMVFPLNGPSWISKIKHGAFRTVVWLLTWFMLSIFPLGLPFEATPIGALAGTLALYWRLALSQEGLPSMGKNGETEVPVWGIGAEMEKIRQNYLLKPEDNPYRFSDVYGNQRSKQELKEFAQALTSPETFETYGLKLPSGLLLTGEPGNGKTLLAKALAGEAKLPMLVVPGSYFNCIFSGTGERRVQALFRLAETLAPCLIFMDEIDCFAFDRNDAGSADLRGPYNQLLVEMDGFEKRQAAGHQVLVLAATNERGLLDEACLRSGRFDRHIEIVAPWNDEALRFLEARIAERKVPLAPEVNLKEFAQRCAGYSFAELEAALNEASIFAFQRGASEVGSADLYRGFLRAVYGHTPSSELSPSARDRLAWQVAAEAVVAQRFGSSGKVRMVSIERWGEQWGKLEMEASKKLFSQGGTLGWKQRCALKLARNVTHELQAAKGDGALLLSSSMDLKTLLQAKQLALIWVQLQMESVTPTSCSEKFLNPSQTSNPIDLINNLNLIPEHFRSKVEASMENFLEEASMMAKEILQAYPTPWRKLHDALLENSYIYGEELEACLEGIEPLSPSEPPLLKKDEA